MLKDYTFLGESGLTSTSANHIANLAKEHIQTLELALQELTFYKSEVTLIGTNTPNVISEGATSQTLKDIPVILNHIIQAKSLIAWLREGIKAKDSLCENLDSITLEDFCKLKNLEYPQEPVKESTMTEDEYISSLSIKERNRYYSLQTKCAVLGKAVHPSGTLTSARKDVNDKVQHPRRIDGSGRDALLYSYKPTVNLSEVEQLFFNLQAKYRVYQAELNGMLHKQEQAINSDAQNKSIKYSAEYEEYRLKRQSTMAQFKAWLLGETKRLQELKIVIPNDLTAIYDSINTLGK